MSELTKLYEAQDVAEAAYEAAHAAHDAACKETENATHPDYAALNALANIAYAAADAYITARDAVVIYQTKEMK